MSPLCKNKLASALFFSFSLSLAGCASVGPDYQRPAIEIPSAWQAKLPHGGETASLVNWWASFDDPVLVSLIESAQARHPSLEKAAAAIDSARAGKRQARAGGLPGATVSGALSDSGNLQAEGASNSVSRSLGLDASWEVDLFGSVRRSQEAAQAQADAAVADWHQARISLAAETAAEYVRHRACEELVRLQESHLQSLQKTAAITAISVKAGFMPAADLHLAQAAASSASASVITQRAECDLGIKALVELTGLDEGELRQKLESAPGRLPEPAGFDVDILPARLVSQRPDLIAAERTLAQASAQIGVAQALRYPRLSLLGGLSVRALNGEAGATTQPWSFGPSLSLPVFDGGALRAQADRARAGYDMALAQYRQAVGSAIREVEQAMVRLDAAQRKQADLDASARDYRSYYTASHHNWQNGGISLLSLELASRNAIQAEQNAISTRRDRILNGIALYKALGGGWEKDEK